MKKRVNIILSLIMVIMLSTTLAASSLIREVRGKENKGITVKYNNQVQNLKDGHGNAVYPVIIDGSTYLPVRAIADMMGADITWDGQTKTISIQGNDYETEIDDAVPTDLPSVNNNSSKTSNKQEQNDEKISTNKGTLRDPIEIGTSYSYNYSSGWDNNIANADYKVTLTKVKSITRDDICNLGFEKPKDNASIEYVMVTMKIDVSNATYKGDDSFFLNMYRPNLCATETSKGDFLISYTDLGFKECIREKIDDATSDNNLIKVYPGESKGYTAEGNIIIGILKNCDNYLSISTGEKYRDKVFFKLN